MDATAPAVAAPKLPTPEDCLQTLHGVVEQVAMDGKSRDIARAATTTIAAALAELAALRVALTGSGGAIIAGPGSAGGSVVSDSNG